MRLILETLKADLEVSYEDQRSLGKLRVHHQDHICLFTDWISRAVWFFFWKEVRKQIRATNKGRISCFQEFFPS